MSAITTVKNNFFEELPGEINHLILSHLDVGELGRVCQVCKAGDRLASDDPLWKRLFPGTTYSGTGLKAFITSHALKSFDEIVQRFRTFLDRIQFFQKGLFVCDFALNPESKFAAKFFINTQLTEEFDHKEHWVFIKSLPVKGTYLLGDTNHYTCRGFNAIKYIDEHSYPILLDETAFSQGRYPYDILAGIGEQMIEVWELRTVDMAIFTVVAAVLGIIQSEERPD